MMLQRADARAVCFRKELPDCPAFAGTAAVVAVVAGGLAAAVPVPADLDAAGAATDSRQSVPWHPRLQRNGGERTRPRRPRARAEGEAGTARAAVVAIEHIHGPET